MVFLTEYNLLLQKGHQVKTLIFDNSTISSFTDKLKLTYKLFYNTEAAESLQKIIDLFHPEIIHVHNFFYVASPSIFFVAKKNNIPIVMTLHNYRLICSGALLLRANHPCELCVAKKLPLHGILYGCHKGSSLQTAHLTLMTSFYKILGTWKTKIQKYIVLTEFSKGKILESSLNLAPEQIAVKGNSVMDNGYNSLEERKDYFLFIGRLSPEKGIDTLLRLADLIDIELQIIGTGEMSSLIEGFFSA